MDRKTIILLASCFFLATVLVLALYAATQRIVHEPNNFLREYQKAAATPKQALDMQYNSYYLAGITEDQIYLGNTTAPFRVLVVNSSLTDSQRVKLRIKNIEKPKLRKSTTLKIDPPYFYLADGVGAILFRGRIGEWEAESFDYDSNAYFTQLVPISKASFAVRTSQAQTLYNILGKVQLDTPHIKLKPGLLQKQVDGVFCTDGMLLYNEDLNRLVYTYFYRNEYIVYDTNLNLDYRGHTIDTFSRAQIKVGHISSDKKNKLMDKKFVNVRSCTSGNYLFVRSNLLAKNDPRSQLEHASVIDVYDLRNNTYKFSFTLPNYREKRVRDFMIFETKTLVALYGQYIVKYDLQPHHFSASYAQKQQ